MVSADRPPLPPSVEVSADADVDELWGRFEQFEALHHRMRIANPMSTHDLDAVVGLLAPTDGDRVLDLACGYGELLRRLRDRAEIVGLGVDLSPWMIATAAAESHESLRWVIGEAAAYGEDRSWDIVACLGASWIWHGPHGTIRAVAQRAAPGARIAIGDLHIRPGLDPAEVGRSHGRVDSLETIEGWYDTHGVELLDRIDTTDASWEAYQERIDESVAAWAQRWPGEESDRWVEMAAEWRDDHARDRAVLAWSVWVGEKRR